GSERKGDQLFRSMVESVSDYAIFAIDLEERILTWNTGAEEIFGYRKEEIVGKGFAILFPPEDHAEHVPERELEKAKIKGRSGDYRWHRRKDGSLFWVFGSVNSLKDESGNLIGYVKVACDATWRKEAEESLRESEADFRAIFELAGTGIAQADLRTG